jgi:hypothetical protein
MPALWASTNWEMIHISFNGAQLLMFLYNEKGGRSEAVIPAQAGIQEWLFDQDRIPAPRFPGDKLRRNDRERNVGFLV